MEVNPKTCSAVFSGAGLGAHFFPTNKAMTKELLPILDKTFIQFAVEEAVTTGITDLIFLTGRAKRTIEDHFYGSPELEAKLLKKGKIDLVEILRDITTPGVNCIFVLQAELLGLGYSVLWAEPAVGRSYG